MAGLLSLTFIWPTPYRYEHVGRELWRFNRFTGGAELVIPDRHPKPWYVCFWEWFQTTFPKSPVAETPKKSLIEQYDEAIGPSLHDEDKWIDEIGSPNLRSKNAGSR
jgi:hypothetical protein